MKFFRRNSSQTSPPLDLDANSALEASAKPGSAPKQPSFEPTDDGVDQASIPIISPVSPFLWPETRVLNRSHCYINAPVFGVEIVDSKTIFGVVHNLTIEGVDWIARALRDDGERSVCLIIAIYPACATTSEVLRSLVQHCDLFGHRLKVRLKPMPRSEDRVTTNLCIVSKTGSSIMVVLPSGNFSLRLVSPDFLHLCFATDTALHHQFTSWFDYQWAIGNPLDATSANIPDLVPAVGDPEADRQWQVYLAWLSQQQSDESNQRTINVDSETGDILDADGNRIVSVLDQAKVPRPSIAMVQVGKVLHKGSLATIDNSSRVGPLDCPISAELFGVDADRRTGTVSRETKFRVSAIDEKTLKKLESFRKRTRELLNTMSYPLADGARWVPHTARPLLEQELQRVNEEGKKLLGDTVGEDVHAFVESKRQDVAVDAQKQYSEMHAGKTIPQETVDKILKELKNRLRRATGGKLLPMLSFLDVRIATAPDSDWSTQASQAFRFLVHVAKYPRDCLTDSFFMRGLRVDQKELMSAMNVVDDSLVKLFVSDGSGIDLAHEQNRLIERIQAADSDDILKCDALYRMMQGGDEKQIQKILASGETTGKATNTDESR
jgi:hypothetical protein